MTRIDRIVCAVMSFSGGLLVGPAIGLIGMAIFRLPPWCIPFTFLVPIGTAIWGYRNAESVEAFLNKETGE